MLVSHPILILEDDIDEQELLTDAFNNIKVSNPIKFFADGEAFLDSLMTTADNPFLILSAINLHKLNGLEVRSKIQQNEFLKSKGIPFIFFTLTDDADIIHKAYDLTVQGYFIKGNSMAAVEKQLSLIVDYWRQCRHPNNS